MSRSAGNHCRRSLGRLALATLLVWIASAGRAHAQLSALISPGPLAKAHASLEGLSKCQTCHEQGQKTTAAKCLTCHAPVAERIRRKAGVHKSVTTSCAPCHAEHAGVEGELRPFEEKRFDHASVTGFALTGKHAPTAAGCAACHKTRSFLSLSPSCTSCHTDVHKGSLGTNCTTCHSTQAAFKDMRTSFDHSKAKFALTGAHVKVACSSCHLTKQFTGVRFGSCADCHRDPHERRFTATCSSCHTTAAWRTNRVDHTKTAFPLIGRHAAVACSACHAQPATRSVSLPTTCSACHTDVHRGTFKQECSTCHTQNAWGGAKFDHAQTKFALSGGHAGAIACEKCHVTMVRAGPAAKRVFDFRGLATTCVSCHTDVHKATLGAACESCHSPASFKVTTAYAHRGSRGPVRDFFTGPHQISSCAACHLSSHAPLPARTGMPVVADFTAASRTCASCHTDTHLGQLGAQCERCHTITTPKFAVASFAHENTAFPLTGRHRSAACTGCHKPESAVFPSGTGTAIRLKGVSTQCRACHADVHLGQLPAACETCHQTSAFELPNYTHRNLGTRALASFFVGQHAKATCVACHKTQTAQFPAGRGTAIRFAVDTRCVSCHTDVHKGALGDNCAGCHRP